MEERRVEQSKYGPVLQAVLIAVITAVLTGYVSGRVVEAKVEFLSTRLDVQDRTGMETRARLDEVGLRQAKVIGQADAVHDITNRRIERLEGLAHTPDKR